MWPPAVKPPLCARLFGADKVSGGLPFFGKLRLGFPGRAGVTDIDHDPADTNDRSDQGGGTEQDHHVA